MTTEVRDRIKKSLLSYLKWNVLKNEHRSSDQIGDLIIDFIDSDLVRDYINRVKPSLFCNSCGENITEDYYEWGDDRRCKNCTSPIVLHPEGPYAKREVKP